MKIDERNPVEFILFSMSLVLCILFLPVLGCFLFDKLPKEVERKNVKVEFIEVTSPPKHFYCKIKDHDLNVEYPKLYISKHFNPHRDLKKNTVFNTTRVKYLYSNGRVSYNYPHISTDLRNTLENPY